MPTPGLSLAGFLTDPSLAINHLRHHCKPPANITDAQLLATWQAAKAALGTPFPSAGSANPQPIPASMQPHISNLMSQAWVQERFQGMCVTQQAVGLPIPEFKIVEIDPLLAFQVTVDTDRSSSNCGGLNRQPTEAELLETCLPSVYPTQNFFQSTVNNQSRSVIIKTRNHNLQMDHWGVFTPPGSPAFAGVTFRVSFPFVHVVRLNGRCYLFNGYHRAYGCRMAGATHVPCIFREVSNARDAGINPDAGTFDEQLLTSADPPTLAHFTQGRALAVDLRQWSRVLHVTWEQYAVPDEYD
jgi:hypothetical protein